jgi:hypothetical protein
VSHVRELLARDRADLGPAERRRVDDHLAACASCRALEGDLVETDRLLSRREPYMPLAAFSAVARPPERVMPIALGAAAAIAILAIAVLAPILATLNERPPQPSPTAAATPSPVVVVPTTAVPATPRTPAASPSPTATPTRSPLAAGMFENAPLGYRIRLPDGYRRSSGSIRPTGPAMGGDSFTAESEQAERERCQRDIGHVGFGGRSQDLPPDIHVSVSRANGETPRRYATTPRVEGGQPMSQHRRVEDVTVDGHPAVRLVWEQTGESAAYVIGANDRIYVITTSFDSLPSRMPKGWFDGIVGTFDAIQPVGFPSPTPTVAPTAATQQLADALARAFAARDADAVGRLITPTCWLFVYSTAPAGGQGRARQDFINDLREQFARADFSVTVERKVQVETRPGDTLYFVRSTWREPTKTTQVDLIFRDVDAKWYWASARHIQPVADYTCLWYGDQSPKCR